MATLYHQVWIAAPSARVFEAITTEAGIGGWWDRPTTVTSGAGIVLEFHPGSEHGVLRARVLETLPNERVTWEFISRHPATSPASAWTGTRVVFGVTRRA